MMRLHKSPILQIALLLLAAVCLLSVVVNNNQSFLAVPLPLTFSGEYSYDGENWQMYEPDMQFSAMDGDLILRGHFDYDVYGDGVVRYLSNHLAISVYVDGESVYVDDLLQFESLDRGKTPSTCTRRWNGWQLESGIPTTAELEIHLHNPHRFGNESAYNDFLKTLCVTPVSMDLLALTLESYGQPFRIAGIIVLVLAIVLIGAAFASSTMQITSASLLWKCGFLALFAGGFILLDTIDISLTQNLYAFNTYGRQLCMMLFPLWAVFCMLDRFPKGKIRKVVQWILFVSAGIDGVLILVVLSDLAVLFDLLLWWVISQLIICPALLICGILAMPKARSGERVFLLSVMVLLFAVVLDLFGVGDHILSSANCTKIAFVLLFVFHMARLFWILLMNHQAGILAAKLKKELEESRIAIMLSQIQPHFLYNTLGTIRELCHIDPKTAESATIKFSEFLRKNMDSLSIDKPIPFGSELSHAQNYLELEQLRFGDQLVVKLDIETTAFSLPTLTLQPIVENAVRHGVRRNEDGGEVKISTREYEDRYEVLVQDNGPGFDTTRPTPDDGRSHVGIKNVRERLQKQCGGALEICSAPGEGTTVRILLQKEKDA